MGAVVLATREHSENLVGVSLDVAQFLSDPHKHIVLISRLVSSSGLPLLVLSLNLALEGVNHNNLDQKLSARLVSIITNVKFSVDSFSSCNAGQRNGASTNEIFKISFVPRALAPSGKSSYWGIVINDIYVQILSLQIF